MSWKSGPDGVNRWTPSEQPTRLAALAAAAPGLQQPQPASAPPQPDPEVAGGAWRPEYGPFAHHGTAALVRLGRESFQLPPGWQISPLDDAVLVALDPDNKLYMLTAEGAVTNLTPAAASALGRRLFETPEAVPG